MKHRQRIFRGAVSVLTAVAAGLGLASCGTSPQSVTAVAHAAPSTALAVVTGDANSPEPGTLTPSIQHLLERAFINHSQFALIDAGGRPRLWPITLGGNFGNSDARRAGEATQLSEVEQAMSRVVPSVGQSNPWLAVSEAVGWLQGQGGGTLVVENSGLDTAGFLDYLQPGMLEATPANLVAFAKAHDELPDAKGISVILQGIGWTAAPRGELDTRDRANLLSQWVALLRAAGASVTVNQTPLTGPGPHHAPKVSVVNAGQTVAWRAPVGMCSTVFNSLDVHFVVGTARLTDPMQASTLIGALVRRLLAHHEVVNFTGTTSSA